QGSDWSAPTLSPGQLEYAATDAAVLRPLFNQMSAQLQAAQMTEVSELEMGAVPALAALSLTGTHFDGAAWQARTQEARHRAAALAPRLDSLAPPRPGHLAGLSPWKWDSPAENLEVLKLLGVELESTDDSQLAKVDHPLAAILRDYRAARKQVNTYGDTWLKRLAPDGRIYAKRVQLGA